MAEKQRGRPAREGEAAAVRKTIRFTDDEEQDIDGAREGKSFAEYVREAAVEKARRMNSGGAL